MKGKMMRREHVVRRLLQQWILLIHLLVISCVIAKNKPKGMSRGQWGFPVNERNTWIVWEEEMIEADNDKSSSSLSKAMASKKSEKRKILELGLVDPMNPQKQQSSVQEPHPLRTDEWEVVVRWRRRGIKPLTTWRVEFHTNGYVRMKEKENDADKISTEQHQKSKEKPWISVGRWKLLPAGPITWTFSTNDVWTNNNDHHHHHHDLSSTLIFFADLHPNPFGPQPKFLKGLVLLQPNGKQKWFRPVVATFKGNGVGRDTADFSYQTRNKQ